MKDDTWEMLQRAGLADKEVCAKAHPNRIRLAVGRDEHRIREVVSWLTDGDPGQAYVKERVPRSLLNALFPGLSKMWKKLTNDDAS